MAVNYKNTLVYTGTFINAPYMLRLCNLQNSKCPKVKFDHLFILLREFCWMGSEFAKGGPKPLAELDPQGSIYASGFGPEDPYPGGRNPLEHWPLDTWGLPKNGTLVLSGS